MKTILKIAVAALAAMVFSSVSIAQNLKLEDVIAKHLDSIGTKAKRDELKTLMALGYSEFESRTPVVKGGGKAVVVSDPENLFFVISLNSKEYPFEKIGFFDGKASLPFITAGTRSFLGTFITEHERLLSDGLFGGTMSLRWPFLDIEKSKPRAKLSGTKKIDGRKMYVLDFTSGSNDFSIKLYFDGETFNHVRSEYRREVVPRQGTFGQANQQASAVVILTEHFSDFKTVDGYTLPHAYRVNFLSNSNTSSNENIWRVNVAEYRLNQKLMPDFFTFNPTSK